MPQRHVLGVAILIMGLSVPASHAATVQLGFHGGLSIGYADFDNPLLASEDQSRPGLQGGMACVVGGGELPVVLRIGLQYQRRGGRTRVPFTIFDGSGNPLDMGTSEAAWALDYITVPISAGWRPSLRPVRPYVVAGIDLAFRIGAEVQETTWLAGTKQVLSPENVSSDFKTLDVGGILAGGVEFDLGSVWTFVEVTALHGLRDTFNPEGAAIDVELVNRTMALSLGLLIPVGPG
jgi:hypothetical protein